MSSSRLSDRALCVAAGLGRSGRVHIMPPGSANIARGYMRLERVSGGHYWLAVDGSRLLKGRDVTEAEAISPGFVSAMEKLGAPRRGLDVPPAPVKSCLASMA